MNRKTILTGIAAFATTMAFGLAAQAADFIWTAGDVSNDNWTDQDNWYNNTSGSVNGYPNGDGDQAIFNSAAGSPNPSNVVLDANLTVGHLQVRNGTTVAISAASRLELGLDDGSATDGKLIVRDDGSSLSLGAYVTLAFNDAVIHEIGGVVAMTSQSNDAFIEVNADATFGPYSSTYGLIKGEDAGAQIQIAEDAIFTSEISLEGMMEMRPQSGTATFVNRRTGASSASGLVHANAGGLFKLADDLVLDDDTNSGSYLPVWRTSVNGSELQFNEAAASLIGNFADQNCVATLRFNANVATSGSLTAHTGRIYAVSFSFVATGGSSSYNSTGVSQPDTSCP